MDKFIARYTDKNGVKKSFCFDKSKYNEQEAEEYLQKKGIQNFFFFFEPNEPTPFGENGMHFQGEIGFDITMDNIMPYVEQGKDIIIDSFGGDLWEGWKIHDAIKLSGKDPEIKVLGTCASAAVQVLLSTPLEKRSMTGQSRMLIHNPWAWQVGDDAEMQRAANDLRVEKTRLANFYSSISNKSVDEILAIMKEERFMYIEECTAMNFVNNHINENEMNAEQEAKLNSLGDKIENIANSIKNVFLKPVKNIVVQDVNGTEIDFGEDVETVDQISVGDSATVNGEAANGEYTLQDGTVYVFESGELTEIREAESDDDMEALRQENEALKEQIAELQNSVNDKEKVNNDLKSNSEKLESDLNEVKKDFDEFKNRFSDEKENIKTPEGEDQKKKGFSFNKEKLRNNG